MYKGTVHTMVIQAIIQANGKEERKEHMMRIHGYKNTVEYKQT